MQKYLYNLVYIIANEFCIERKIDIAGSNLVKHPHKQSYTLQFTETEAPILTITLKKSAVPTFLIH